jgi:hypothetical protein
VRWNHALGIRQLDLLACCVLAEPAASPAVSRFLIPTSCPFIRLLRSLVTQCPCPCPSCYAYIIDSSDDNSSCYPSLAQVQAMSTGGHGETTRTLDHLRLLRDRLDRILSTVRTRPLHPPEFTRSIHDAHQFFGKWYQENVGHEGDCLTTRNQDKVLHIERTVEEAHRLASHCEYRLGLEQWGSCARVGR